MRRRLLTLGGVWLGLLVFSAQAASASWADKSYNSNVTFRDRTNPADSLVSDGAGAYVTGQGGLGRFGDDPFGAGYDFYYFQTSQGRTFNVNLPANANSNFPGLTGTCATGGTIYVKSSADPFWFQPPRTPGAGVTKWGWALVQCNTGGQEYEIWYGTATGEQCVSMSTDDYWTWTFNADACVNQVGVSKAVKVKGKTVYQPVASGLTATYGQTATITGSVR